MFVLLAKNCGRAVNSHFKNRPKSLIFSKGSQNPYHTYSRLSNFNMIRGGQRNTRQVLCKNLFGLILVNMVSPCYSRYCITNWMYFSDEGGHAMKMTSKIMDEMKYQTLRQQIRNLLDQEISSQQRIVSIRNLILR